MASGQGQLFGTETKKREEKKRPLASALSAAAISATLALTPVSQARAAIDLEAPLLRSASVSQANLLIPSVAAPLDSIRPAQSVPDSLKQAAPSSSTHPVQSPADSLKQIDKTDAPSSRAAYLRVLILLPVPGTHRCFGQLSGDSKVVPVDFSLPLRGIGLSKFPKNTERQKLTDSEGFNLNILLPIGRKGFIIVSDGHQIDLWPIRTRQPVDSDCQFIPVPGGMVALNKSEIIFVAIDRRGRKATPSRWDARKYYEQEKIHSPKELLVWPVSASTYGAGVDIELPSGTHLFVAPGLKQMKIFAPGAYDKIMRTGAAAAPSESR